MHTDTMDEWPRILQKRFKTNLSNTRYTLNDVRNKKQCGEVQEFPIAWTHYLFVAPLMNQLNYHRRFHGAPSYEAIILG